MKQEEMSELNTFKDYMYNNRQVQSNTEERHQKKSIISHQGNAANEHKLNSANRVCSEGNCANAQSQKLKPQNTLQQSTFNQPSVIDKLFESYQMRFKKVFELIQLKNSFICHQEQFESLLQNIDKEQKNNQENEVGISLKQGWTNEIECKEQIKRVRQGLFEQHILRHLKQYYNEFQQACKEDNEITQKEQQILKRFFNIKADAQALKVIVFSLTNKILNENLQIYENLLKLKYSEDAMHFLQKQINFRKSLQEIIYDDNSRMTSVLLFLINYSRLAFVKLKEQSESLFLTQFQDYKTMNQAAQVTFQAMPSTIPQSITNKEIPLIEHINNKTTTSSQLHKQFQESIQFPTSPQNVANQTQRKRISLFQKVAKKESTCDKLDEFVQAINNIQVSDKNLIDILNNNINKKNNNKNNNNNVNENYHSIKNQYNQDKNQKVKNKEQQQQQELEVEQREQSKEVDEQQHKEISFINSPKMLQQQRIQGMFVYNEENSPIALSYVRDQENTLDSQDEMRIQNTESNIDINCNISGSQSSFSRSSNSNIIPELREIALKSSKSSKTIIQSSSQAINNLINTELSSPIKKADVHRNSLPSRNLSFNQSMTECQDNSKTQIKSYLNSQIIESPKRRIYIATSSTTTNNNNILKSPILSGSKQQHQQQQQQQQQQQLQQAQKNVGQFPELYYTNQNISQVSTLINSNNFKSEYFSYIPEQKRQTVNYTREIKRFSFTSSYCYKRKWKTQEKSNLDDYTQLDEQYQHLACNSMINSIESISEKKMFIDKILTNLMKLNSAIGFTIKNYFQVASIKLKNNTYPQPFQMRDSSFINDKPNYMKNKMINSTYEQNIKLNNQILQKDQSCNNNCSQRLITQKLSKIQTSNQLPMQSFKPIIQLANIQSNISQTKQMNVQNNSTAQKVFKNQQRYTNLAVISTPTQGGINNVEINQINPNSDLNCLSLINQQTTPRSSKTITSRMNEEILLKKDQSANNRMSLKNIQKPQTPISKTKGQVVSLINTEILQKQTKLNTVHFNHLCEGGNQDIPQNNSQSHSTIRHKALKERLSKFKNQEKCETVKGRDILNIEESLMQPLFFKKSQINETFENLNIFQRTESDTNQNNQQFQQYKDCLQKMQQKEIKQSSINPQVQFILLQSSSPKLSQIQKEKNRFQIVQNQQNLSSISPKNNSNGNIQNNMMFNSVRNNSTQKLEMPLLSQQLGYKSNKTEKQQQQQQQQKSKNIQINNSYVTSRQISLNQLNKSNQKSQQNLSNIKVNFPLNSQVQIYEDEDIFKNLSIMQNKKNSPSSQDQIKKNHAHIFTVK